jgi:N-acetyl-gamma-glutamylphosphate reductase
MVQAGVVGQSGAGGANLFEIVIQAKDNSSTVFAATAKSIKAVSDEIAKKAIPTFETLEKTSVGVTTSADALGKRLSKVTTGELSGLSNQVAIATQGLKMLWRRHLTQSRMSLMS